MLAMGVLGEQVCPCLRYIIGSKRVSVKDVCMFCQNAGGRGRAKLGRQRILYGPTTTGTKIDSTKEDRTTLLKNVLP